MREVEQARAAWWRRIAGGSIVDPALSHMSGLDEPSCRPGDGPSSAASSPPAPPRLVAKWLPYIKTAGVVALCTAAAGWIHALRLAEANQVMVLFLGVAIVAARYGRGPASSRPF